MSVNSATLGSEEFDTQVAPLLTKYCAGCHNDSDQEGDFSVSSLDSLRGGTPDGPVVVAGSLTESRLWTLMSGREEPAMPPEGEAAPNAVELEQVRAWILAGAPGLEKAGSQPAPLASRLKAPRLRPARAEDHFVGASCVAGDSMIEGKHGRIDAYSLKTDAKLWTLTGLPGKVNSLRISQDEATIVAGGGIVGLGGEIYLIDRRDGRMIQRFRGHTDAVYCATLAPSGRWLASGSYDHSVILWDVTTGQVAREFPGHNGPIFDLDFDPSGQVLATASADQTVKLWHVDSGQRLDTLGQPEGEMRCVRFSRDGRSIFAAGSDHQIRKWDVVSRHKPAINPMLVARFAHERDVLQLGLFGNDYLVSASNDGSIKLWLAEQLEPVGVLGPLQDRPVSVNVSESAATHVICVSQLTGPPQLFSRQQMQALIARHPTPIDRSTLTERVSVEEESHGSSVVSQVEMEPNNVPAEASSIPLPAVVQGTIERGDDAQGSADADIFRIAAAAGETWIIEVTAGPNSRLDSRIEVLHPDGSPVLRTRMQAVRESYFTFRGKDSDTSDDFRLHKWEDMELDEYLYAGGEINRLWLYPRGPDSGFKVYPGRGKRHAFFGTTPLSHVLGETAYVVRELANGEAALPNGLPTFPIYFDNDDDGLRRADKNSRLTFVAPNEGDYLLRVRDARGFGGTNFQYTLKVRRPAPDFALKVSGGKLDVPRGSGREWSVTAQRMDGLEAPISVSVEGLPAGFLATNPLIIEAGQEVATGTIYATDDADLPDDQRVSLSLVASCELPEGRVTRKLDESLQLALTDAQEVRISLREAANANRRIDQLTIRPGETISARIVVDRQGEKRRIGFGKDDSGRNLPHGAYIDNIGLNGLLIPEGETEREFFITAAPKVAPGRRQFHLRGDTQGKPSSRPIWLNVVERRAPDASR